MDRAAQLHTLAIAEHEETFMLLNRQRIALALPSLALIATLLLAACGGASNTSSTGSSKPTATTPKAKVSVLYAGSLVNLMEKKIGPAFQQATGYPYQGEGKGSTALANEIKGHLRSPDIFISADPAVDQTLMGATNGNYVSWYATFTRTAMVIGYNPKSKFAADLQAAANGVKPWYQVLEEPGLRIGRTDPLLDPKGVRTIMLMELAENYYHQPGLTSRILGAPENSAQIFPEEALVSRLGSSELDAGFFYLNEVKDQNLPYINLPTQINLSDPSLNSTYAQASYTPPKGGKTQHGAAIVYTITIPSTSKNTAGAIAFVNFLLSSQGQAILTGDGLLTTQPAFSGDTSAIPSQLRQYIH
jgi:molybdate/tungstate transport system substrate-binding protein